MMDVNFKITHSVYFTNLNCDIDLFTFAQNNTNVIYTKTPFDVVSYRHRKIKGSCLIYKTGRIIIHGPRGSVRKFVRKIEKCGVNVNLTKITLLTQSAVYYLKSKVNIHKLVNQMSAEFNPELFHAAYFRKGKLNFIVYNSGCVIITGIKGQKSLNNIVYPTLLELELL